MMWTVRGDRMFPEQEGIYGVFALSACGNE